MVIVIQSKDKVGLVAAISGVLSRANLNILALREYVDREEKQFFIRLEVEQASNINVLESEIRSLLPEGALVTLNPNPEKKLVVLVSKEYHCLSDILVRNHFKTLGAAVQCVIGNHDQLSELCKRFEVPFLLIPSETVDKEKFENEMIKVIEGYKPDFIALAKFMRILSPAFVARYAMRIINIHHSFLPAFVGSKPYQQAHQRGVKIIGATAHFVTEQLDEGPIIAQQTFNVNHAYSAHDMIKAGKEIEQAVFINALKLVFEDRVFVYKNKTVVFE